MKLLTTIWCWRVWDHHTNSCFLTSLLLPYFLSLYFLVISFSFFFCSLHPFGCWHFLFNHPSIPSLLLTILDLIYPLPNWCTSVITSVLNSCFSVSLIFHFYTNFLPSLSLDLFPHVYRFGLPLSHLCTSLFVCVDVHVSHTMVPSPVYQAAWTVHSWGSSTVHLIAARPLLALRPISGDSQVHLVGTGQILLRATASAYRITKSPV